MNLFEIVFLTLSVVAFLLSILILVVSYFVGKEMDRYYGLPDLEDNE